MEEAPKMLCPYCNAEWTGEMVADYELLSEGCATCGYGRHEVITVSIRCSECGRIIYSKEIDNYG